MCVVLSHIARLLKKLQHIFYMTSISGDTQLSPVPEVLYCHAARGGEDTPHVTLHVSGVVTSAPDLVEEGLLTVSNAQRGALSVALALLVPFGLRAVRQPHTDGDCRTAPCCL